MSMDKGQTIHRSNNTQVLPWAIIDQEMAHTLRKRALTLGAEMELYQRERLQTHN